MGAPKRQALDADSFVQKLASDPRLGSCVRRVHWEEGCEAKFSELPPNLHPDLLKALKTQGFGQLWSHQRQAVELALGGENVVAATETSSGKSLCFHLPVLDAALKDSEARALYLFPTNPLANDQLATLSRLVDCLPEHSRPRGPVRLQGAMGRQKDQIAADDPQLVFTNPEMAHLYLLPRHRLWQRFWAGLRYIVVDEIHLYRGAFGGHLAQVLRRIRRCAWRYGASPVVIAASATVANPKELARELCATDFALVNESTAPRGPRSTVLWRPQEEDSRSFMEDTVELFQRALTAGLPTIVFARSRQMVERLVSLLEERSGRSRVSLRVRAYRGGYRREERELIEEGLRRGTVLGVVSTNALEVGIDIGALEVCIIAGYPGTIMATRQQAGRVGRRERSSAVILVSRANPLDNYLFSNPQALLEGGSERAVVGRLNPNILRAHLEYAAREFPLWEAEAERLGGALALELVEGLCAEGRLAPEQQGERKVFVSRRSYQPAISLRSASDERWTLVDPDGEEVGQMEGSSVYRQAFPGAVYLHQGRSFRVDRHEGQRIFLTQGYPGPSTQVQVEREVRVGVPSALKVLANKALTASFAEVEVIDRYTGYLRFSPRSKSARLTPLEPELESSMKTEALVLELGGHIRQALNAGPSLQPGPAMHGAEHLLTAFASSLVLCDREDLEGHSELLPTPRILLLDRHPGGLGFARAAFEQIEELLERAAEAVASCSCADGCPACVHDGRCMRSKEGVSKAGARLLLALASGRTFPVADPSAHSLRKGRALGAGRASQTPILGSGGASLTPVQGSEKASQTPVLGAGDALQTSPSESAREQPSSKIQSKDSTPQTAERSEPHPEPLGVGSEVEHAIYGAGMVVAKRARGRLLVRFEDGESRLIVPGWLRQVAV